MSSLAFTLCTVCLNSNLQNSQVKCPTSEIHVLKQFSSFIPLLTKVNDKIKRLMTDFLCNFHCKMLYRIFGPTQKSRTCIEVNFNRFIFCFPSISHYQNLYYAIHKSTEQISEFV